MTKFRSEGQHRAVLEHEPGEIPAEGQPGRYQLVRGEVTRMPAEGAAHALIKMQLWVIFRREIKRLGLPYQALPDGLTVEIGADTDYEPVVAINSGPKLGRNDLTSPLPVVVVEVLSPSIRRIDTAAKFDDYFAGLRSSIT